MKHEKQHTNGEIEAYQCSLCSKSFFQKRHFKEHVRSHTEERRFKCVICGEGFFSPATLKRHMVTHSQDSEVTHTDQIPLKCMRCDRSFKMKDDLDKHLDMHAQERPCQVCGKYFTRGAALSLHMACHSNDRHMYLSPNYAYYLQQYLDSHSQIETTKMLSNLKQTRQENFHSSETPYVIKMKVEED